MEGLEEKDAILRVLMLPWFAHDHIVPFLELAKRLSRQRMIVHFICSSTSIKQELNQKTFPFVKLLQLHLPELPEVPELPTHLNTAFDRSDILIYDFLHPWAPRAARDHGIPAILFLANSASSSSRRLLLEEFPGSTRQVAGPASLSECVRLSSEFVAVRTFDEIESRHIEYLRQLIGKAAIPVGPLLPDVLDEDRDSSRKVTEWLDNKERSSVVFASFTPEEEEETEEISKGLEMSEVSFIWVGPTEKDEEEKETGLVLSGWAPQREILSHRSIGGFLTSCEWGSVLEGMRYGVPMIALPIGLDQTANAELVAAELGIGVEVKRRGGSGTYRRDDVAKVIREVVVSEEGLVVRRKAKELAETMGRKGNDEMGNLVVKMSVLCTGGKERKDVLKNLSSD